jgi:hypothetical protein
VSWRQIGGIAIVVACNAFAFVFAHAFEQHYKRVAKIVRTLSLGVILRHARPSAHRRRADL